MTEGKKFLIILSLGALVSLLGLTLLIWVREPSPVLPPDGAYPLGELTRNGDTIWGGASYHVAYYVAAATIRVKLPINTSLVTTTSENKMVVADGRATLYTNWRDFDGADYSGALIYLIAGTVALFFGIVFVTLMHW